jgi:hypothetical protein
VQALGWFEAERASLVAAARQSAGLGLHEVVAQIAVAMWEVSQRTPYVQDWLAISLAGVASARCLGDDAVLGWMLNSLGVVCNKTGRFADASEYFTEALVIYRRTGDRAGEAGVLNSRAVGLSNQERFEDALEYLRQALAIFVSLGGQTSAGVALHNIGNALLGLKRHDEALEPPRAGTGDRAGDQRPARAGHHREHARPGVPHRQPLRAPALPALLTRDLPGLLRGATGKGNHCRRSCNNVSARQRGAVPARPVRRDPRD